MHKDTRCAGAGEKFRGDSREQREAGHSDARDTQAPTVLRLNQTGQMSLVRPARGAAGGHTGKGEGIHSELGGALRSLGDLGVAAHPHIPHQQLTPAGWYQGAFWGQGCETLGLAHSTTSWAPVGVAGACRSKYTRCLPRTPGTHSQLLT